jgi:transcriptional regulator with XRE-family HTH domain
MKRSAHAIDLRVAVAVRRARREQGWSQRQLAAEIGISLRHMVDIECGENFTVAILLDLARVLPALHACDIFASATARRTKPL